MMPRLNADLERFIGDWLKLKLNFNGEAGLQISVNTTDEEIRRVTMPCSLPLHIIANKMEHCWQFARGRKIALNFALTDAPIDAKLLAGYFDPKYFMCKITPMHNTRIAVKNGIITEGGYDSYYPYRKAEEDLKEAGFDVLVFIPSKEEDESRITCGNAILAGRKEQ